MDPVASLHDVGIRFLVPRHSRLGKTPRLIGIRKHAVWGIRNVSFEVGRGEAVGVIGPNGAGKTTLLRTLAGIYEPDEGRLSVNGRVGPLLSLQAGMMHQLSGWENIMLAGVLLGLPRKRVAELSPQIAEFSGLGDFLDAEVRTYSSGMRARLGFSVAVFTDPDLLVLDEILMVGDEEFRARSFALITRFLDEGKPLLLASHDLDHLQELCARVIYLDHGRIVAMGDPVSVIERYRAEHPGGKQPRVTPG